MAAIGFLDYTYQLLSGQTPPPIEREGSGGVINTINNFADNLNKNSQKAWEDVNNSLALADSANILTKGDTIFTQQFIDDMRKVNPKPTEKPNYEVIGRQLYTDIYKYGKEGVFKITDDNKGTLGKTADEIIAKNQYAWDTADIAYVTDYTRGTFIDSYKYYDHPENVPHTTELTLDNVNYQTVVKSSNAIQRIMDYLKNNPDKYNITMIRAAFNDEAKFMDEVQARWNDPSLTKSIMEGDAVGTFTNLLGDGLNVTKDTIATVGDATLGNDLSPVKPLWDLFKSIWDNAGSIIEYAAIAIAFFALLWAIGEIKYVSS